MILNSSIAPYFNSIIIWWVVGYERRLSLKFIWQTGELSLLSTIHLANYFYMSARRNGVVKWAKWSHGTFRQGCVYTFTKPLHDWQKKKLENILFFYIILVYSSAYSLRIYCYYIYTLQKIIEAPDHFTRPRPKNCTRHDPSPPQPAKFATISFSFFDKLCHHLVECLN